MKKFLIPFVLGLVSLSHANLKIVTTTADLASIAKLVGGKAVTASSIITGSRDAHRIEAKPSYMSRVAGADVFIAVGLDLEVGYERAILDGARNGKVMLGRPGHIYASDFAYILDKPTGAITRGHGDIHPGGNPHVLLDPYNGRRIGIGLARKFQQLDRANAAVYEANLKAFLNRLDSAMFGAAQVDKFGAESLWQWHNAGNFRAAMASKGSSAGGWSAKAQELFGRPVFSYHRSFPYLARRFGFRVIDELEPKPGLEPSPGHLASLIRSGQEQSVKVIIQEPFFSAKSANLVASRIGAKVAVLPQSVGQAPGADDYIMLFDVIVQRLAEAL